MEDAGIQLTPNGVAFDDVDQRLAASERQVTALARIAQAIAVGEDLDTVLRSVAETVAETLAFPQCTIYEYSEASETFRVLAACELSGRPDDGEWIGRVLDSSELGSAARTLALARPTAVLTPDDPDLSPQERDLMQRYGEQAFLSIPMIYGGRGVGVIELTDYCGGRVIPEEEIALAQAMANQAVAAIENAKTVEALRTFHKNSLSTLASALNAKDPYTHGHSARVAAWAVLLCRELGIDARLTTELEKACYLHDIGKIGITDRILQKRGRLTAEERALMQAHADMSARIVSPLFSDDVVQAVRHHHEAWDGSGYPDGLRGEDIPYLARVMHVVDSYDAMSYSRPYAQALTYSAAVAELERSVGSQFDRALVPAFLKVLERVRTMQEQANQVAEAAAALIDGDEHTRLVESHQEDSPTYREMVATLRRVRDQHPEVRFISTLVLYDDCARFVLDAEEDEAERSHIGDPYPYQLDSPLLTEMWRERTDEKDLYRLWFSGEETVLSVDEWGVWVSGVAAIRDRRGQNVGVVNVDVPATDAESMEGGAHREFGSLAGDLDMRMATSRALAITDELTGLYNHGHFQGRLGEEMVSARERACPMSVLLVGIDGIRRVNDTRGHAHGDVLLNTVGQALLAVVPPDSVCARYGGAKLGAVLVDHDSTAAVEVAERVREALERARELMGDPGTVSIGVATFPDHAAERESLLEAAETARQAAKLAGAGQVAVAGSSLRVLGDPHPKTRPSSRLRLESADSS